MHTPSHVYIQYDLCPGQIPTVVLTELSPVAASIVEDPDGPRHRAETFAEQ